MINFKKLKKISAMESVFNTASGLFANIADGFQSTTVLRKFYMFDWLFDTTLCYEDLNNYFRQIYRII